MNDTYNALFESLVASGFHSEEAKDMTSYLISCLSRPGIGDGSINSIIQDIRKVNKALNDLEESITHTKANYENRTKLENELMAWGREFSKALVSYIHHKNTSYSNWEHQAWTGSRGLVVAIPYQLRDLNWSSKDDFSVAIVDWSQPSGKCIIGRYKTIESLLIALEEKGFVKKESEIK